MYIFFKWVQFFYLYITCGYIRMNSLFVSHLPTLDIQLRNNRKDRINGLCGQNTADKVEKTPLIYLISCGRIEVPYVPYQSN